MMVTNKTNVANTSKGESNWCGNKTGVAGHGALFAYWSGGTMKESYPDNFSACSPLTCSPIYWLAFPGCELLYSVNTIMDLL